MKSFPPNAKVLLVNPGLNPDLAGHEPFHLGYLASYIAAHGYRVRIADELAGQDVGKAVEAFQPDLVGITATTPVAPYAYRHADRCRAKGFTVVMGGVHVSTQVDEARQHCDVVVKGEGERALLRILQEGVTSDLAQAEPISVLDEIPMPARHLLDMDFYMSVKKRTPHNHLCFGGRADRFAGLLTSRGCPYSCIFCHNSWKGLPFRFHSAERVLEELQLIIRQYGITALFFMDDDFFAHGKRLHAILEGIQTRGIHLQWGCQARVKNLREEDLRLAKAVGCQQVTFGFESGSQKILSILKNNTTTVEENARAIEICRRVGIRPTGTFMIGNPTETLEDIEATRGFIRQHRLRDFSIHITTPFPGTKLWDWCRERNLIPERVDWTSFNTAGSMHFTACETLSAQEIERLRWDIILKDLVLQNKWRYAMRSLSILNNPLSNVKKITSMMRSALWRAH